MLKYKNLTILSLIKMYKDRSTSHSAVRSNVFKLFLKVAYVCIFRDSSGIAFHNFDAASITEAVPIQSLSLLPFSL